MILTIKEAIELCDYKPFCNFATRNRVYDVEGAIYTIHWINCRFRLIPAQGRNILITFAKYGYEQ